MKVAILADSQTTRHLAPFDDPSWDIWIFGNGYVHAKRADAYFEPHDWPSVQRDNDVERMYRVGPDLGVKRVVLHPSIPSEPFGLPAFIFPHEELLQRGPRQYFTSTVAWLIAYALQASELKTIGIWGVDMAGDDEYGAQLACTSWWLGLAEGRGIEVVLPEGSLLLKGPLLYTLEDKENEARKSILGQRRLTLVKEATERNSRVTVAAREKAPKEWQEFVEVMSRLMELDEIENLMTNAGKGDGLPRDPKWDSGRGWSVEGYLGPGKARIPGPLDS